MNQQSKRKGQSVRKAQPKSTGTNAKARLVEKVMWQLSRDILQGVYAPGDSIREPEVSKRLGISRAPVRDALRTLEHEGMVESIPWRGARVINPSLEEIADLFDLLAAVDGVVVRLAARCADEGDLRRYSQGVDEFRREVESPNPDFFELIRLSYQAAEILVSSCGSSMVANFARRIGRPAYWLHRFLIPAPTRWIQQALANHKALASALLSRDEARSERCARMLVMHTKRLILARARDIELAQGILRRTQFAAPNQRTARSGGEPRRTDAVRSPKALRLSAPADGLRLRSFSREQASRKPARTARALRAGSRKG
ncbi:GntR family transcriptional regulator [Rudaea sp.]|uniref:GntR family transcriptional regulator n=1 Tax=Rudaea sp. TaxID=2136325 RepID=UPI003784523F